MDADEIEHADSCAPIDRNLTGTASGNPRALISGVRVLTPSTGGQDPTGTSSVLTAIASVIINSSLAAHSIIITVIVTITVLTVALAFK
jgi:hypothetical protein